MQTLPPRKCLFYFYTIVADIVGIGVTMTSLEIAELTGKNHSDVLRDIRNMLARLEIGQSNFAESYRNSQNKEQPMFRLDKRRVQILIMWYEPKLCDKVLDYIDELELKLSLGKKLPTTFVEALKALVISEEEKIRIEAERDEAIRTKQRISDEKTAKALGKAWWLTTANTNLKLRLQDTKWKLSIAERYIKDIEEWLDISYAETPYQKKRKR